MATAIYDGVYVKTAADDYVATFKFTLSYDVLRLHPKLMVDSQADTVSQASSRVSYDSSYFEAEGEVAFSTVFKRPFRCHKAKDLRQKKDMMSEKLRVK